MVIIKCILNLTRSPQHIDIGRLECLDEGSNTYRTTFYYWLLSMARLWYCFPVLIFRVGMQCILISLSWHINILNARFAAKKSLGWTFEFSHASTCWFISLVFRLKSPWLLNTSQTFALSPFIIDFQKLWRTWSIKTAYHTLSSVKCSLWLHGSSLDMHVVQAELQRCATHGEILICSPKRGQLKVASLLPSRPVHHHNHLPQSSGLATNQKLGVGWGQYICSCRFKSVCMASYPCRLWTIHLLNKANKTVFDLTMHEPD